MSNLTRFENLKQIVVQTQPSFEELARIHGAVNFKREASFAMQLLEGSNYLADLAMKNQDSLRNAVINVAAIGLSLSPVQKLAYLIPRDNKVCLDISYQGLVQLGIDCGAIKYCKADLVYANDNFVIRGMDLEPAHEFKPFAKDRGDLVGGYCTAKTPDGDFITIIMDIEDIYKIRAKSEAFKKKSGPWVSDESEMIKKTLIRRGYKSWPKKSNTQNGRLAKAMQLEEEGETIETTATVVDESERTRGFAFIREGLLLMGRTEEHYISHLVKVCRREIKKLEDLTDIEMNQAIVALRQWITEKKTKDTKAAKSEATHADQMAALDEKLGIKNENNTANK